VLDQRYGNKHYAFRGRCWASSSYRSCRVSSRLILPLESPCFFLR